METSHSEHVLQEDVVLGAAGVGLQLRGQRRQQLMQTSRQEKENLGWECAVGVVNTHIQRDTRLSMRARRWNRSSPFNGDMLTCPHSAAQWLHYNTFCSPCRVTVSDWTMRNKDKQQRRPVERWGPNIDLQNRRWICHKTCTGRKGKDGKRSGEWAKQNNHSSGTMTADIMKS